MIVTAVGHLNGDPSQMCESLTLQSEDWADARKLAALNRVLTDPDTRLELLDAAAAIEENAKLVRAEIPF